MNLNEIFSGRKQRGTEKKFCSDKFTVCQKTYSLNKQSVLWATKWPIHSLYLCSKERHKMVNIKMRVTK